MQTLTQSRPLAIIGLLALLIAGNKLRSEDYSIGSYTIDGGGVNTSAGGIYEIAGTIGQPDAGYMAGGAYEILSGFWEGASAATCACLADVNGDLMISGEDIQGFVACALGNSASCDCADVNASGGVTVDDVGSFVTELLSNAICP